MCSSEPIHTCFFFGQFATAERSQFAPWPSKGYGLLDRHQGFFLPNHLHITYMFLSSLTGYHCNLLESYAVEPQQRDPQVQPHFLPSFGWTARFGPGSMVQSNPSWVGREFAASAWGAVSTLQSTWLKAEIRDYMGVSKNRGGPPKWMVYNGKPY